MTMHDAAQGDGGLNSAPLRGFDPEFKDIVDYILTITYRIWEGKQPELCRRYYSHDCPVYMLGGYSEGAEVVTSNTIATQQGFPDRTLHADNIVWGGNEVDGFHTSHLIDTAMTNLGPSEYGEPTGKRGNIQVIAHCVVRENRIVEEWLVRDNYSLCQQMGFDPLVRARELATLTLDPDGRFVGWLNSEFQRVQEAAGPSTPDGDYTARGAALAEQIDELWKQRSPVSTDTIYAESATVHASARDDLVGHAAIREFFAAFMDAMPNVRFSVDYVCEHSMIDGEYVAIRWTMAGHHAGDALWGAATQAPVFILGESQYRLEQGRVVEEWFVFDELAVLTQVERARLQATT